MKEEFKQIRAKCMENITADLEDVSHCESIDELIRHYYIMAKITTNVFLLLNSIAINPEINAAFFKEVDAIYSKSSI